MLTTPEYQEFSLRYHEQVNCTTHPRTRWPKNPRDFVYEKRGQWLELMAESGCQALGVDWNTSLTEARHRVGHQVALQGNMDPAVMLQSPEAIRAEVARILAAYGSGSGHVFNLGHGITPDVPPEHVAVLIDAVHTLSPTYHT